MIKYLSPSSISTFEYSVEDFYKKYVLRFPREPQTQPMAAGSAFDAFVKAELYSRLVGRDSKFEAQALFESQVEPHNRDWALDIGKHIFDGYVANGCLTDLLLEMDGRIGEPRFEFRIEENIDGVPLLGLPDLFFTSSENARVIYDWKVNGACATRTTSPAKGYIRLKPGAKIHKDCHLLEWRGITINAAMTLDEVNKRWADQLAIYSWLMGEKVGSDYTVFGIDQICGPINKLRFASHRLRITPEYQRNLFERIRQIWRCVVEDHYFLDLDVEESRRRCALLAEEDENDIYG